MSDLDNKTESTPKTSKIDMSEIRRELANLKNEKETTPVESNPDYRSVENIDNQTLDKLNAEPLNYNQDNIVNDDSIDKDSLNNEEGEVEPEKEEVNAEKPRVASHESSDSSMEFTDSRERLKQALSGINLSSGRRVIDTNFEITAADGKYEEKLDFQKVTDVKKYRLPAAKLPLILIICAIVLALVGGVVTYVLLMREKPVPVTLVKAELNIRDINMGYVGDTMDLSGIKIIATYSDGNVKTISEPYNYITKKSVHYDVNNVLVKAGEAYIEFTYEDKKLVLNTDIHDFVPTSINAEILGNVSKNSIISFDKLLVKVFVGQDGARFISANEMKTNVKLYISEDDGVTYNQIATTDTGYNNISTANKVNIKVEYSYTDSLGQVIKKSYTIYDVVLV